ncbi:uncharacterized protein LOC114333585 [Diabrotica virgifera virgifera]|uniref:Gustatory receptor n=1 Tax=Diabrotica virgifera virgifera TaxID=50390 RepID=A0A6P7G2K7_DIAVI|nr:uncharacterized protein LOC114333585 [Diabrotica virgifera virgifera]
MMEKKLPVKEMPARKDTELLDLAFKVGKLVGLYPQTFENNFRFKFHIFLYGIFTAFIIAFDLYNDVLDVLYPEERGNGIAVIVLTSLVVWYTQIINFLNLFKRQTWSSLFTKLSTLDSNLGIYPINDKRRILTIICAVLFCSGYTAYEIFLCWPASNDYSYNLMLLFTSLVISFNMFLVIFTFHQVTTVIERRIKMIKQIVKHSVHTKTLTLTFVKIKMNYSIVYDLVNDLNDIFGYYILTIVFNFFYYSLDYFNVSMRYVLHDDNSNGMFVSYGPHLAVLLIYIVNVAFSSDKISRAADNLIKTCFLLHPDVQDQVLTEELIALSKFMTDLFPEITMAGWFTMNKKFILVLISSLTSYVIIIIQFQLG